jgi:hypothetical protein
MTILVALGLPMARAFRPALVSRVIPGNDRLIALSGTMTLRGSVLPDAAADEEPMHASERLANAAIDAVSRPDRDRLPIFPCCTGYLRALALKITAE